MFFAAETNYLSQMRIANNGNIYHFKLDGNRTSMLLQGELRDRIAGDLEELDSIIFARGFDRITDMEMGSDGYLYVLASEYEAANVNEFMSI